MLVCCTRVNNIIRLVVATYILGLNFTKINDRMRSHDENITKEKKRENQTSFQLIPCPFESNRTNCDQVLSLDTNNTLKTIDSHFWTHLNFLDMFNVLKKFMLTSANQGKWNYILVKTCFMISMLELKHVWKNVPFKKECWRKW
jgi:hypothetical protein